jgi:hypothetical protein
LDCNTATRIAADCVHEKASVCVRESALPRNNRIFTLPLDARQALWYHSRNCGTCDEKEALPFCVG